MLRSRTILVATLMFSGLVVSSEAPRKMKTPAPVMPPTATPQAGFVSPQTPGKTLTAAQQQQLQALILQHQRIRARFQAPEVADLDRLTAHVRQILFRAPLSGNLLASATQILSRTVPGLGTEEATALAEYVLGGIAALPPAAAGSASGGQSALLAATKQVQETQSFNMQYLALQEQMQNESRQYSLISNIMKTKHDTVKNSISNLR